MELIPIKTKIIKEKENIVDIILQTLKKNRVELNPFDVLVISSKIVALWQGRVVDYTFLKPSKKAKMLVKKYSLDEGFAEVVVREADAVLGGVHRAVLTLKNGSIVANAGADLSNAPKGKAILWPKNPEKAADKIKKEIEKKTKKKNIGIIIADSHCQPLRRGTIGIAIATAGISPIIDERGKTDLFGGKMRITTRAVADEMASAALLLTGETSERTPAVLIRGAPAVIFCKKHAPDQRISFRKCLFSSIYSKKLIDIDYEK